MSSVLDYSLVGLALLVSAGYAASSLGPRSVRRRLLAMLSRVAVHVPFLGLRRAAQWLAVASAAKAHGDCGSCDSCGSAQATGQQSSAPDVTVPVGKIGRRI